MENSVSKGDLYLPRKSPFVSFFSFDMIFLPLTGNASQDRFFVKKRRIAKRGDVSATKILILIV